MRTIPVVSWIANAAACLAGPYGAVAEQARRIGCRRQAAYDQAHKVHAAVCDRGPRREQLLEEVRRLRRENAELWAWIDRAVEFALPKRQRFAVTAASMGLSTTQIRTLLALVLGTASAPSRAAIGRWTAAAGEAAGRILESLDAHCRASVFIGCLDETFFHGRPVLVGIEPASMVWFLGKRADSLRAETWARELQLHQTLRHVIADAGIPAKNRGIYLTRPVVSTMIGT